MSEQCSRNPEVFVTPPGALTSPDDDGYGYFGDPGAPINNESVTTNPWDMLEQAAPQTDNFPGDNEPTAKIPLETKGDK